MSKINHPCTFMSFLFLALSCISTAQAQGLQWNEPWILTWTEPGKGKQQESFATEQQARAAKSLKESLNRIDKFHENPIVYLNLEVTRVGSDSPVTRMLETMEDANNAVDRAREMLEARDVILKGDTIREYRSMLEKVYNGVTQFKSDLLVQSGKINGKIFDQVNKQISDYNRDAERYNELIRSPGLSARLDAGEGVRRSKGNTSSRNNRTFTPASLIQPMQESNLLGVLEYSANDDLMGAGSSLVGKQGQASFESFEVSVTFGNKSVSFGEGSTAVRGTFVQKGNEILMSTDKFDYRGTIQGERIVGTRTPKGSSSGEQAWKIDLGQKRDNRTSVAGKTGKGRIGRVNGGADFWVTFQENGTVVVRTSEDKSSYRGDWSEVGSKVSFTVEGNVFEGELKQSRLAGRRMRRNAEGLEDTDDTWWLTIGD